MFLENYLALNFWLFSNKIFFISNLICTKNLQEHTPSSTFEDNYVFLINLLKNAYSIQIIDGKHGTIEHFWYYGTTASHLVQIEIVLKQV